MGKWTPKFRPTPQTPPERLWITCPGCGKRAYRSRKAARTAARELPPRADGAMLRPYVCRDPRGGGRFHIGHVNPLWVRRDLNATPNSPRCPTECDDDCEIDCHEGHHVWWKREHEPERCPGRASPSTEEAG